jgi:vacuolar-type H+-ATPase subunit C/Vma6
MIALDQVAEMALRRFRAGSDTAEIAEWMRLPECKVSKLLWVARCREKGLPATFMNRAREVKRIAPKAA